MLGWIRIESPGCEAILIIDRFFCFAIALQSPISSTYVSTTSVRTTSIGGRGEEVHVGHLARSNIYGRVEGIKEGPLHTV